MRIFTRVVFFLILSLLVTPAWGLSQRDNESKNTLYNEEKDHNPENERLQLTQDLLQQQKEHARLQEQEFRTRILLQEARRKNTSQIIIFSVVMLCLTGIALIHLQGKKKALKLLEERNVQVRELKQKNDSQKNAATALKKKINDHLHFGLRIQNAVLPPVSILDDAFTEYFILYRPCNIASGDFYWMTENEGILIIAVVDCTGHGIPGALMSMLGVSFLNRIVSKSTFNKHIRTLQASDILNQLRNQLVTSLNSSEKPEYLKDEMDMSLCIFDFENRQLQFSGAHNPLLIIRNGEQMLLNADKMAVNLQDAENSFSNQQLKLQDNDLIYLYSDGYYNQPGGPKGRKIFSTRFRNYLREIHHHPMLQQKKLLDDYFNAWIENNEQVDDVTVIGIKFMPRAKKTNAGLFWPDKHFLIAEDTEINYILLVEALKSTKVKITRVTNGFEAVEFCRKNKVDLILMDINMPVMDGVEATRQIRSFNRKLPIIAHTALAKDDDMLDIKEAGCNDYIAKPVDLKSFLGVIHKNLLK